MKQKKLRDIVYGFVELDEQETDIVNHPYFQRLRRIKQLSLTDMVYPSANHSRFEHSIGVMQMASDMYDSITRKEANLNLLKEKFSLEENGIKRYRKIVRLAALLHDAGHPPFSHSGETLMPLLPKDHPKYSHGGAKRYEHEEYSIVIIKEIFRPIIENHSVCENFPVKAEEVTALLGDSTVKPKGILSLWRQLISSQLDADRADYLLRDSLHLGVAYGLYDRNRLVACMTLGKLENAETSTRNLEIAVENKAWHVAESLVLARYQMFTQVYLHRVRRIYDYHITEAIRNILTENYKEKCVSGCYPPPERIKDYLSFDDWTVYAALKNGYGGEHGQIILTRRHYKCKYETELIPTEKDAAAIEKLERACQAAGKASYTDDIALAYWYKKEKDINISRDGLLTPLSEISSIVGALLIANPQQKRFYAASE